jgi:hypothetical protein
LGQSGRNQGQPEGAANGSQPFSSGDKSNVTGGWLPSLTFALGVMARNFFVVALFELPI